MAGQESDLDRGTTMNPMDGSGEVQLGILMVRSGDFFPIPPSQSGLASGAIMGQPNVSWGNYARFVDYTAGGFRDVTFRRFPDQYFWLIINRSSYARSET